MTKIEHSGAPELDPNPPLRLSTKNSVKIAIVISSFEGSNTGQGGHYYSAQSLATALRQTAEVYIFNVGNMEAKALEGYDGPLERVAFASPYDLSSVGCLERRFIDLGIELAHGFDRNTVAMLRIISGRCQLPVVFTSPGGLKAASHPAVKNLIVFNRSSFNSFRALSRFKHSEIHLIPNRALPAAENKERLNAAKLPIDPKSFTFVTINRLTSSKEHQIVQSLNLLEELVRQKLAVQLVVIGVDDGSLSPSSYRRLQDLSYCHLLTEPKYTKQASDFLPWADAVIAMGRGVMEACAYGKTVLVSSAGGEVPQLLDQENFQEFFAENFTNRCRFKRCEKETIGQISKIITNRQEKKVYEQQSSHFFSRFFDVNEVIPEYLSIYRNAKVDKAGFGAIFTSFTLSKLPSQFADRLGRKIFKFILPSVK